MSSTPLTRGNTTVPADGAHSRSRRLSRNLWRIGLFALSNDERPRDKPIEMIERDDGEALCDNRSRAVDDVAGAADAFSDRGRRENPAAPQAREAVQTSSSCSCTRMGHPVAARTNAWRVLVRSRRRNGQIEIHLVDQHIGAVRTSDRANLVERSRIGDDTARVMRIGDDDDARARRHRVLDTIRIKRESMREVRWNWLTRAPSRRGAPSSGS